MIDQINAKFKNIETEMPTKLYSLLRHWMKLKKNSYYTHYS